MDEIYTFNHTDTVPDHQERTPVRDLRVFGTGHGKFMALRLRALVEITAALEAELQSMESDVLDGEPGLDKDVNIDFYEAVESFEKKLLLSTLTLERGSQTRAARRLSLGITTLNAMLKRYGIEPGRFKSVVPLEPSSSPE